MAAKDELRTNLMPMAGGVDERTQAELVDPSRGFLRLENLRADRRGSYTKRYGFTPMSLGRTSGSDRTTLKRIIANDGNPCVIDSTGTLDAYVEQAAAWRNVGTLPECIVTRKPTASTIRAEGTDSIEATFKTADAVEVNGYRIVAANDGITGVMTATVYDAETGAIAYPATSFELSYALAHDVLVVAAQNGTRAHVIYANTAGTDVFRRTINTASLSSGWSAETTLTSTMSAQKSFDATSLATSWALAWTNGVNSIGVLVLDDSGGTVAASSKTANNTLKCALGGSEDVLWLADSVTSGARVMGLNPSTLAVTSTQTQVLTPSVASAPRYLAVTWTATGYGYVIETDENGTHVRKFYDNAGAVAGTNSDSQRGIQNTALASRPWLTTSSRVHVAMTLRETETSPNEQQTLVVCDVTDVITDPQNLPRVVAVIAPRLELHNTEDEVTVRRQPCHPITSGNYVRIPIIIQRSPLAASIEIATLDYSSDDAHSAAELQGTSVIGSGLVTQFDGNDCVEANWVVRPVISSMSFSGAGTINLTSPGWTYVAVYESIDAQGNVHRSGPSDPVSSGAAVNKLTNTIIIHPLYFTNRQSVIDDTTPQVQIIIYRTIDQGSTYYRCTSVSNYASGANITFTDTLTDALLIANEQLYTQPGLLGTSQPHACPPGLRHIIYHGERIVGVGDDGYTIWPSAPYVYGEGLWWGDVFQLPIPEGGPITALASSDGRLYAFKRDRIFVIDGDGPSDNGTGGQFSAPVRLPTELGCLSHRSVVVTPVGVFFQSPRGIEALSGQQVQWVGEAVQDTLATYPTVTSAVCRQTESRIYFTCTDSGGTSGVTLVFDYAVNAWTIDTVYDSDDSVYSAAAVHALAIDGEYYRGVASTGRVWSETTSHLDNAEWITATIETAWIKPGGVHGAAEIPRAIFVGVSETPCVISVEWAYDYRDTFGAAQEWDESRLSVIQEEMGRIHIEAIADENARCMAAKLRLSDAPPANTSYYPIATAKGITWFGYSVEAAVKPGRTLLPVSARAG